MLYALVGVLMASCDQRGEIKKTHSPVSYEIYGPSRDTVNLTDENGYKQGKWFEQKFVVPKKAINDYANKKITKKDLEGKVEYSLIASGSYKDNKKEGEWKYYAEDTVTKIVTYKEGEVISN